MRLAPKYKPELICSKDDLRPVINDAELTKIDNKTVVVATDGRKLVVVPAEAEESEFGRIPKKALTFARQNREKHQDLVLKLNGKVEFENGWSMPRVQELTFPNVVNVIPTSGANTKICINAQFLYEIARAMGVVNVTLNINSPDAAIKVTSPEEPEAFGVIMPVRI